MSIRTKLSLAAALLLTGLAADARADFIVYDLGELGKSMSTAAGTMFDSSDLGSDTKITLPGKAIVQPGGKLSYTHPSGATVHFKLEDVKIIRAPTNKEEFNKKFTMAGKNPEALMKAGVWGLKKGQLEGLYKAVDKVLDIEPTHEAALKVRELKKTMRETLPENPETEKKFRALVKRPDMRFEKSKHFILMTDTPTKPHKGKVKSRALQRLDLLEKVYESFLLLFHAQDVQLDIPKERMMVVLFNTYDDFHEFANAIGPGLGSAAGFWEQIRNVSYFYDWGTNPTFKALEKTMKDLREQMKDAQKARNPDIINYVKVIDMLMDVQQENSDITVVSHECTHQMAGNTGLFPRHVDTPRWIHEGLACYFENPSDGTWAGIGAVSGRRMKSYKDLSSYDRVHSNLNFIIRDEIFDLLVSNAGSEYAYGQAWALTHFMIETHLKEFVAYYRVLGDLPPDVKLNPDLLQALFSRVCETDIVALDGEWRQYMTKLKTEVEKLDEADGS